MPAELMMPGALAREAHLGGHGADRRGRSPHGEQRLDGAWLGHHVGVDEQDPLAAGPADPLDRARCEAEVRRHLDDGRLGGEPRGELDRAVVRGVVDDDELGRRAAARKRLAQRGQAGVEDVRSPVADDDR